MSSSSIKYSHTQKPSPYTSLNRLLIFLHSLSVLALFVHQLTSASLLLLIPTTILSFLSLLLRSFRFNPITRTQTIPQITNNNDLPSLDVFVCTADPWKEPPSGVASTALSAMAYEYPTEKLSVYVSDDGGSEITLFAMLEAGRFGKSWLPFCRKKGVEKRAPEAYFADDRDFDGDEQEMKLLYQTMKEKVDNALAKGYVSDDLISHDGDHEILKKFKGFSRQNHPSIIQVLVDGTVDRDIDGNTMPNFIYVSREKNVNFPHNFKGGALNTLLRVSSVLTNAPIILTLDCDMYSNDPQTPHRALCYFLDESVPSNLSFVQFPQRYQGLNKDDIYGGELHGLFRINARGMDGLRGAVYAGTGCFFARRTFDGPPPSSPLSLSSWVTREVSLRSEEAMKKANEVTACAYEVDTKWGIHIGFRYGSLVEDYNTGYRLHCEGWKSVLCDPERAAFLGDSPKNLTDSLTQCQRWVVGLYEVGFSRSSPLIFGTRKASFLMGLCYAYYAFWGLYSIPVVFYALVPQVALIYGVPLFPKASSRWFYLHAYILLSSYAQEIFEFLTTGCTIRRWWNDHRMWLIRSLTSFSFATLEFVLNKLNISTPNFTLTDKASRNEETSMYNRGLFYFGVPSPFFVVLGTVAIVNASAFLVGVIRAMRKDAGFEEMFAQLFLASFGLLFCWPVFEGMFFRKDMGKITKQNTNMSVLYAGLVLSFGYFIF